MPIASRIFLVDELDFYTFGTRPNNKKNLCEKKLDDPMVYSFAIRLVEREIAISSLKNGLSAKFVCEVRGFRTDTDIY